MSGAIVEVITPTVAVIGGGPSGLRAAADLASRVDGTVLVLERESVAGGIPRHSDHLGYGMRDLHRVTTGPRYAEAMRRRAEDAGVRVLTNAMVTGWAGDRSCEVTTPAGRLRIDAAAVVLATGARERPRTARLIPGARSRGVYTTGELQNVLHLAGRKVGTRAVVVGAELVSWSAVLTLRSAGCATVLVATEHTVPEAYAPAALLGRTVLRTRVATGVRVVRILGHPHVTGVELEQVATGRRRVVPCDTVVLTADWVPDNELARAGGIGRDPASGSPSVDASFRTDQEGVFAVGNLVHPVETADVAALDGAAVVAPVVAYLGGRPWSTGHLALDVVPPLRWVSPSRLSFDDASPARDRLVLWVDELVRRPCVVVRQDGTVRGRRRLPWPAAPGRAFRVPWSVLDQVDRRGGPVQISLDH